MQVFRVSTDFLFYHLKMIYIKEDASEINVVIDGKTFCDQPVLNDLITYKNIQKTATGHGDDYTIVPC